MSFSRFLSLEQFPFSDLPSTPQEYYGKLQLEKWTRTKDLFKHPMSFEAQMVSDEDFVDFWKMYYEGQTEFEKYMSDWTLQIDRRDADKMSRKYKRFMCSRNLTDISTSKKEKIESEFESIRPTLYQHFLEAEVSSLDGFNDVSIVKAFRLNCDLPEVRPTVPVLPLEEDEIQSNMSSLPDDVFSKIMNRLELIEVFQLTQVCKQWRKKVYRNAPVLRRAEHSLTTHLLTFTNWMNPANVVKGNEFRVWHNKSAWSLVKWCCNMSDNIETLVLHELKCPSDEVVDVLRQCPHLKHLHFKFPNIDKKRRKQVHLPNLETLIVEEVGLRYRTKTVIDVFKNSRSLRVFKGRLEISDMARVKPIHQRQSAFAKLNALELVSISSEILLKLETLDELPLRYLCIGSVFTKIRRRGHTYRTYIDKEKDAFDRLLAKLNHLEVLVALWDADLDMKTLKIMTKKQRNLRSALVRFYVKSLDHEEGFESIDERDNSDDQVELVSFADMLLEKDPSIDLSAFEFIVNNVRSKTFLQDARTGFSIYRAIEKQDEVLDKWSLSHPLMRRQLGIDF